MSAPTSATIVRNMEVRLYDLNNALQDQCMFLRGTPAGKFDRARTNYIQALTTKADAAIAEAVKELEELEAIKQAKMKERTVVDIMITAPEIEALQAMPLVDLLREQLELQTNLAELRSLR